MMIEFIGKEAMLEQLGEECCELGAAALKLARIYRDDNPTPVTEEEALKKLAEEYTDVVQCGMELELEPDSEQMFKKACRFMKRLIEDGMKRCGDDEDDSEED